MSKITKLSRYFLSYAEKTVDSFSVHHIHVYGDTNSVDRRSLCFWNINETDSALVNIHAGLRRQIGFRIQAFKVP